MSRVSRLRVQSVLEGERFQTGFITRLALIRGGHQTSRQSNAVRVTGLASCGTMLKFLDPVLPDATRSVLLRGHVTKIILRTAEDKQRSGWDDDTKCLYLPPVFDDHGQLEVMAQLIVWDINEIEPCSAALNGWKPS